MKVEFENLDEKTITKLQAIAEACPVNRLLTNNIEITTKID